jgi:hypothetical protein
LTSGRSLKVKNIQKKQANMLCSVKPNERVSFLVYYRWESCEGSAPLVIWTCIALFLYLHCPWFVTLYYAYAVWLYL